MAICDLLIDLWCGLSTALFFLLRMVRAFCSSVCVRIWRSSSQFTAVMTSPFLTVIRYLAIVYCMKPEVRLNRKIACICMFLTWCVAVSLGTYVAVFDLSSDSLFDTSSRRRRLWHLCSIDVDDGHVIATTFFILMIVFVCTLPLYIHMYTAVRKSSAQMRVKRDGALAKKLALLVLTNLLFSTIPLSIALLSPTDSRALTKSFFPSKTPYEAYVIRQNWVPVLLLSLYSCLNPLLIIQTP